MVIIIIGVEPKGLLTAASSPWRRNERRHALPTDPLEQNRRDPPKNTEFSAKWTDSVPPRPSSPLFSAGSPRISRDPRHMERGLRAQNVEKVCRWDYYPMSVDEWKFCLDPSHSHKDLFTLRVRMDSEPTESLLEF